jgi:hypothetical protein
MDVTFNFDPNCPWTWMTSRWLLRAAEAEGFDVRFAPLSLAHLNRDADIPDEYKAIQAISRRLLRVVAQLESADDHDGIARLYAAYGDAIHRRQQPRTEAIVTQAVADAHLSSAAIAALDDESLDERIGKHTDAVVDAAGGDVGSPVLTWSGPTGDVATFGPLVSAVPDVDGSRALWQATRTLAELGCFAELKLARGELQLSSS